MNRVSIQLLNRWLRLQTRDLAHGYLPRVEIERIGRVADTRDNLRAAARIAHLATLKQE